MGGKRTGAVPAKTAQDVQCPLCGNRFDAAQNLGCARCPRLFRGCGMVACPRCSHEFVRP